MASTAREIEREMESVWGLLVSVCVCERERERVREEEGSIARETVMSRVTPTFSMKRKLDVRFLLPIFLQWLRPP